MSAGRGRRIGVAGLMQRLLARACADDTAEVIGYRLNVFAELWVPEVGGPIDPDSEAHDLIMSVFGGLSKGERNRIKLRVRAAMSAQAALEGRFLGGRPPYGYRLIDAGPHPNPAKAADGKRLHKLEPDPGTAWVVRRIFAEYLAGRGLFAIAEWLTRDQIPSPSQHDRARNRHRTGEGWSKSAIRVIVTNPRYTGRQVWNNGQDWTVRPGRTVAGDRSAVAGPAVRTGPGPRGPGSVAGDASVVTAAMPVTTPR